MAGPHVVFTERAGRRIRDAVRWAEGIQRAPHPRERRYSRAPDDADDLLAGGSFVARLSRTGPDDEQDFPDSRYWCVEQDVTGTGGDATGELQQAMEDKVDGRYVVATNLEELGGPVSVHAIFRDVGALIAAPRYVVCSAVTRTDGIPIYVFSSYPGQIAESWGFIVTGLDPETGCPCGEGEEGGWRRYIGPAVMAIEQPPAGVGCIDRHRTNETDETARRAPPALRRMKG